jgi:predicted nucleic acid-binding protein
MIDTTVLIALLRAKPKSATLARRDESNSTFGDFKSAGHHITR